MPPSMLIRLNISSTSQQTKRKSSDSQYLYAVRDDSGYGSDDDDGNSRGQPRTGNRGSGGANPTNIPSGSGGSNGPPLPNTPNIPDTIDPTTDISISTQTAGSSTVNIVVPIFSFTTFSTIVSSSTVVTITKTTTPAIKPTESTTNHSKSSPSSVASSTGTVVSTARSDTAHVPTILPPGAVRTTLNTGTIFAIVLGISTLISLIVCCLLYRSKVRRARKAKLEAMCYRGPTISSFEPAEYTGTSLFRFPSTMHRSLKSCVTLPSFFIFGSPPQSSAELDAPTSPAPPNAARIPSRSSNRWTRSTYDQLLSPLSFNVILDDSKSECTSTFNHGSGFEDLSEMEYIGSAMTHSIEHAKRSSFGTNTCSAYHTRTKSILKPGGLDAPLPPLPTSSKSIKWEKDPFNIGLDNK